MRKGTPSKPQPASHAQLVRDYTNSRLQQALLCLKFAEYMNQWGIDRLAALEAETERRAQINSKKKRP